MSKLELKKCIGIDRCKYELKFKEEQKEITRVVKVISKYGHEFGEIQTERGKWMISLCLPKYFAEHNAVPFKMDKAKHFDDITECVTNTIQRHFKGPFKTTLSSIEMNITEVYKDCDYEKFFLLLSHSTLDDTKQNARYEILDRRHGFRPITTGIKTRMIKGRYFVKAYDKRRQLLSEYGAAIDYSPMRIEFVFSKLALTKYFGEQRNLNVIFSVAGLNVLINAYIETMNDIIDNSINPYLGIIHMSMVEYMCKSKSIRDTYCAFKENVYDIEQLRLVLKDYYQINRQTDSSRKLISDLNKRFVIPKGTLHTLEQITKSLKM